MLEPSGDGRRQRLDGFGPSRGVAKRSAAPPRPALAPAPSVTRSGSARVVRQRSTKRRRGLLVFAVLLPAAAIMAVGGWLFWPRSANHKLSAANLAVSAVKSAVGVTATLKGQTEGRTNMVIYGMTKDGLRTDSIMLASYYWKDKKLVTLNIPRDLQVYDGYETVKFGEVYAYAKMRQPKNDDYPNQFVADLIAKEYGLPVDYWTMLNMQGEVDLINTLGGIDIDVPDAFTDYKYPTWNYTGYITPAPSFKAGLQHMNGDTALIYSRSRHSLDNNQGSDFARSKRQMLVVAAVLTKVKTMGIVGNIADVTSYLKILGDNVNTNMTTDEMVAFASVAKSLNPEADLVRGNWSTENGFLCSSTTAAGAYITLYGAPGSCTTMAGGKANSKYRELAIYYVQHLIESAPLTATEFIAAAGPNLPAPYTTTTTASSGSSSNEVLGAQTTPTPTPAATR